MERRVNNTMTNLRIASIVSATILLVLLVSFLLDNTGIMGAGHTRFASYMTTDPSSGRVSASVARQLIHEDPGRFLGNGQIAEMFTELSIPEAQGLFRGQIAKIDYDCQRSNVFGNEEDGGYDICLDKPFKPKNDDCLIYSFGINNDWSFDEAMNTKYGCEVHSFDPSMNMEDHMHKPDIYFYNLGLWGWTTVNEDGWQLKSLSSIIQDLGHTNRTIDVLKVDVECAEFLALREMLDSGVHRQVKQLVMEIHTPRPRKKHSEMSLLDYA